MIGRYTSFGPDVHYFGANHPYKFASMSPYFYQKSWGGVQSPTLKDINWKSEMIAGLAVE